MTSLSSLTLCALSSQWAWRRLGRDAERLFSVSAWSGNKAKRSRKFRIDNLADLQELKKTGGKVSEAATALTHVRDSPYFPTITGETLSGCRVTLPGNLTGNISLVTVSMREYGMRHCQEYREHYMDSFGHCPVFELSLIDLWVYRVMSRWMARNLAKTMSHDRHEHFMLYTGDDVGEIRKNLQIGNTFVGYVFLLDQNGRIRWRAHAPPTKQEITSLLDCSQQLLDRL